MNLTKEAPNLAFMTDDQIALEIGIRIRAERIRRQLTQSQMADLTRIPLRTYKRLETSGSGSISTLIAALRACDRLVGFQILLPQPALPDRRSTAVSIARRRASPNKALRVSPATA